MTLKGWQAIVFLSISLFGLPAMAASPSVEDIYQAAKSGRLDDAQKMVEQVLAEHPNSAKAHYVAAEIYAKEGRLPIARNELMAAEKLQPGLPFANPQSAAALKNFLAMPTGKVRQGSFPFGPLVMVVLAVGLVIVVIKVMAARAANRASYYPAGNAPGQAYPGQPIPAQPYPGGGYPAGGMGGGLGSSIVGGLATGAAVGAGMVAGEALAHHFLDGDSSTQAAQSAGNATQVAQNTDLGGADFGLNDTSGWDDSTTFADGDLGGDDWT
jgi:hypothetical protein